MESGLEDRNNYIEGPVMAVRTRVSMESGLEDRNNGHLTHADGYATASQWSPA